MTLADFRLLSPEMQLCYVLEHGTSVAQRAECHGAITCYHLDDGKEGFFAEVTYEQAELALFVLRSFSSPLPPV